MNHPATSRAEQLFMPAERADWHAAEICNDLYNMVLTPPSINHDFLFQTQYFYAGLNPEPHFGRRALRHSVLYCTTKYIFWLGKNKFVRTNAIPESEVHGGWRSPGDTGDQS